MGNAWRVLAVLFLSGCSWLNKPSPDDVCRIPCIEAIGRVDVYEFHGKFCSCYRAADGVDPGAFVQVPL